jgi:hypothetical protein
VPRERLRRDERPGHVHLEDAAPFVNGHLDERSVRIRGGVVDQDVEPAEARDCLRNGAGRGLRIGHVADDRKRLGACTLHEIEDRHLRPASQKRIDDRAPDPVRPTRHQRYSLIHKAPILSR